ncbi:MAG: glycine cleavage system protein T [Rhizobiales bacterium]|nr:glycine cleavage system protein T [Hyphomicrobiales bacterium]
MYIPRDFGDPVQNFWNLVNDAILCDVAVERQVEITGPDAARFTQLLCPRDLTKCAVGQCKYVLMTDQDGGIVNDPILLRLGENHFWLSIADSDVILWAKGVAAYAGMDVQICEPDVSPLQLQGPKSRDILQAAFGPEPAGLKYYRFMEHDWQGVPLVISRTGWSSELGYEIFLRDAAAGGRLWEHLMAVGEPLGLHPGHTSSIRRIEGAMLSYQADMDLSTNPLELGMDRLIDLDGDLDFIGKAALLQAREKGLARLSVGLEIDGAPLDGSNTIRWPLVQASTQIGYVTSAIHSPRLNKNIALALVAAGCSALGQTISVETEVGTRQATVVPKPFYDPNKSIALG